MRPRSRGRDQVPTHPLAGGILLTASLCGPEARAPASVVIETTRAHGARLRAARGWGGSASWSLRCRIAAMPRCGRAEDGSGMPRPAEGRPASPAAQDCSNAPLPLSAVRARHAAPQHDSALRAAGAGAPAPDPTPPALIRKYGRSVAAPLPPGSSTTFSKDSGSRTQDSASRKQNISASEGRRPTENRR